RHGGFSRAERTVRPVIDDADYGYKHVNVADQRRDPASLLNWCERRIRMRKECPEIGWGNFTVLRHDTPEVLALRYDFLGVSLLTVHNFASRPKTVALDPKVKGANILTDVFDDNHSRSENGTHELKLPAYGHRWMHIGAADTALNRTPFRASRRRSRCHTPRRPVPRAVPARRHRAAAWRVRPVLQGKRRPRLGVIAPSAGVPPTSICVVSHAAPPGATRGSGAAAPGGGVACETRASGYA